MDYDEEQRKLTIVRLSTFSLFMRKRMPAVERRKVIEQVALEMFAERGYLGTSMDELAKRAGVSVPVVYDHFASKRDLHRRLLKHLFKELRDSWRNELDERHSEEQRISRSIDAWLVYVADHPLACQMLFRGITGDMQAEADRRKLAAESWRRVLSILPRKLALKTLAKSNSNTTEMLFEVLRTGLQGLALWWLDHPHVPRKQVLIAAMNILWIGMERFQKGEIWSE